MGAIVEQVVEYRDGDTVLEGRLYFDDALPGKHPGILVVHDWNGPDAYEFGRGRQLAQMGYVALVADVYGKGVRPNSPDANRAEAGKYYGNNPLFRSRLKAGIDTLAAQSRVDPEKLGAMGYCFGGTGVLELARMGAPVKGVVSFHGGLAAPGGKANAIPAKLLICHAAQDPAVPREQFNAFLDEMRDSKADYQLLVLNEDVHPFTVPGPMYRERADKRSWAAMQRFWTEVFG